MLRSCFLYITSSQIVKLRIAEVGSSLMID
jgi:hypothetical protein